ncbi:G-alpha-domain-containing protein [Panus rudis PR-1116 ss-1]|nr:G-alpha-domain-containing protein [Panus rudis PR-1116 ss-1]
MPVPRLSFDDDPFKCFMSPPPNETEDERALRVRREAEEKRVSDLIDESLKAERAAMKKKRPDVKLLLLGQSESGKSTTLKNFQLTFAPKAWREERASWRAVIHFNLVRVVNTILDALSDEMLYPPSNTPPPMPGSRPSAVSPDSPYTLPNASRPPSAAWSMEDLEATARPDDLASPHMSSDDEDETHRMDLIDSKLPGLRFDSSHSILKLRLAPLRSVEADLKRFLGAGTEEVTATNLGGITSQLNATPFDAGYTSSSSPYGSSLATITNDPSRTLSTRRRTTTEFAVRAHSNWRSTLRMKGSNANLHASESGRPGSPTKGIIDLEATAGVIAGCKEDIWVLWNDQVVRELLRRRGIRLGDSAEYYMEHLDRIASRKYEPSDDDVLRARLRTLGVQEHKLVFENTAPKSENGHTWAIYDVGGSRTSRAAWLPFFDDAQAILFLAPINCFDEPLAEDPRVNRLQDSMILWKAIVKSKLLATCAIVLFLNKFDLLAEKIRSGVKASDYIQNFEGKEADAGQLANYFRSRFKHIFRDLSPQPRPFYGFVTTAIDHSKTALTLSCRMCFPLSQLPTS